VEYYRQKLIYALKHGVNVTVPVIVKLKAKQQNSILVLKTRRTEFRKLILREEGGTA
jgi:hypothetical protein